MRNVVYTLFAVLALVSCAKSNQVYQFDAVLSNLSTSDIEPFSLSVNAESSFPGGGMIPCMNGIALSTAGVDLRHPPAFVQVEWEHILSGKMYTAKVMLDSRTPKWITQSPFPYQSNDNSRKTPTLVIQWRGDKAVAILLVADIYHPYTGMMQIGDAVGQEVSKPDGAPNNNITYEGIRKRNEASYHANYYPGQVIDYQRQFDGNLSNEQRFGCPRLRNGNVDESKLPPQKLPFLFGANGEHIPCNEYFCMDKQALISDLKKIGIKEYPHDAQQPNFAFEEATNPKPAWR